MTAADFVFGWCKRAVDSRHRKAFPEYSYMLSDNNSGQRRRDRLLMKSPLLTQGADTAVDDAP